jgi:serine/threonine protein kinase
MSAIDVPRLIKRVEELVPKYVPSDVPEEMVNDAYTMFKEVLRTFVYNSIIVKKSYWERAGLRVEDAKEFQTCMESAKQISLGQGSYGSVVKMPARPCLSRNIPRGVKQVAVKTELMRPQYEFAQTPDRVRNAFVIGKKAASLHLSPQMYDAFIVIGDDGVVKIVKVQEVIEGQSWMNVVWKTPAAKQTAVKKLADCVRKMNRAGIVHRDLHSANVMVTKKGEIYIIDFDSAVLAEEAEQKSLGQFNISYADYAPKGILSDGGINFLFHELVKDGTIVLPGEKTVSASNNKNKNKKTRKQKKR